VPLSFVPLSFAPLSFAPPSGLGTPFENATAIVWSEVTFVNAYDDPMGAATPSTETLATE
jgi:hypothetical protein